MFFGGIIVNASCTYQQRANLNETARNIRAAFEVNEKEVEVAGVDYITKEAFIFKELQPEFILNIYNITNDVLITQTNDHNRRTVDINYGMTTNGVYNTTITDFENIITYTFRVVSNLEGCRGDILRTFTITKPKLNYFVQYPICDGLENIPYCQRFITEEFSINLNELPERLEQYLDEHNLGPDGEVKGNWFSKNWLYIAIGVVIVGGATGVTIFIVRKRRAI